MRKFHDRNRYPSKKRLGMGRPSGYDRTLGNAKLHSINTCIVSIIWLEHLHPGKLTFWTQQRTLGWWFSFSIGCFLKIGSISIFEGESAVDKIGKQVGNIRLDSERNPEHSETSSQIIFGYTEHWKKTHMYGTFQYNGSLLGIHVMVLWDNPQKSGQHPLYNPNFPTKFFIWLLGKAMKTHLCNILVNSKHPRSWHKKISNVPIDFLDQLSFEKNPPELRFAGIFFNSKGFKKRLRN